MRHLLIALIVAGVAIAAFFNTSSQKIVRFHQEPPSQILSWPLAENTNIAPDSAKTFLPEKIFLDIPFTPQAPTANWDELHNEACEEAAAIMAYTFFNNSNRYGKTLDPAFVENEIAKLTRWQKEHFGYNLDTTSSETAQIIEKFYGLKTKLLADFSEYDLKAELARGHVVLISENGRLLGNPFYKRPGPIHHMLVLKGYNQLGFITNDPGTKRGMNYPYLYQTIKDAAADWNHSAKTVDLQNKIAIDVWK